MKAEGQAVEGAADRVVRQVAQPQDRAARAVRRDGRPGGGLVRRPVLRAVLPDADAARSTRTTAQPADGRARCCSARRSSSCSARCPTASAARRSCWRAACSRRSRTSRSSRALTHYANPALEQARQTAARSRCVADPADCSFQFDPVGKSAVHQLAATSPRARCAQAGVPYANEAAPAGAVAQRARRRRTVIASFDGSGARRGASSRQRSDAFARAAQGSADDGRLSGQGRPGAASTTPMVILLLHVPRAST